MMGFTFWLALSASTVTGRSIHAAEHAVTTIAQTPMLSLPNLPYFDQFVCVLCNRAWWDSILTKASKIKLAVYAEAQ